MSDEVDFTPVDNDYALKAKFWSRARNSGVSSGDEITLAAAMEIIQDQRLPKRWKVEGFKEWFLDDQSFDADVLEMCYKLPQYAKDILEDPNAQASAKVNILKLMAEIGRKMPAKSKEVIFADKTVQKMDEAQLTKLIADNAAKLKGLSNG